MARGIVGLLLAAGSSRRFGADKRWQPLADGTPLALATAARLRAACADVLVVVRPEDTALAGRLRDLGCTTVACDDADSGMGHSLAAGVGASADAAGWLVALADMPSIATATYAAVQGALLAGAPIAVPFYRGRRGHPVGFAGRWYAALAVLQGDQGARDLLAAQAPLIRRLEIDDAGVLADIDTPEQLAGLGAERLTVDRRKRLESEGETALSPPPPT